MTDHFIALLGAYHDGELRARQRQQVKDHLLECAACRAELDRLRALSALLAQSPAPQNLTPAEPFVAQVRLQLRPRPQRHTWRGTLQWGWRLTPFTLIGVLAFLQTGFLIATAIEAILDLGVGVGGILTPLFHVAPRSWGLELGWDWTSSILLLSGLAVLYWGWLASWLALRRHRALRERENAAATI